MKKITTRQLCIDAMLAALCAVLGYLAIDIISVKVTLEGIPVLIGALLFGPVDGVLIGGVGTFVYQVIRYGFTPTTPLWILPYVVYGLGMGFYAKAVKFNFSNRIASTIAIIIGEGVVTAINTLALYIDSKMFGYYSPGFITGALAIRIVICICKAIILALVIPSLVTRLKTITHSASMTSDMLNENSDSTVKADLLSSDEYVEKKARD